MNISKNGIVSSSNFIEQEQFDKKTSFFKSINNNIVPGMVNISTNKNGTITGSFNTIGSVSINTVKSLAGKTLCCSYEVCCPGARYSTEQGQTAYNYTRYGIHGSCKINDTQYYPFADNLNYSGTSKRVVMTWTVPSSISTCNELTFAVQNFDKPASTNGETWFLRNFKLEVNSYATPFITSEINVSGDAIQAKEIIEI
jgi:hypothetical protein